MPQPDFRRCRLVHTEQCEVTTCFSFLPTDAALAVAGALVLTALALEVTGEPGGTPVPLLMADAVAAWPGEPTAVAVWDPVAVAAAPDTLEESSC